MGGPVRISTQCVYMNDYYVPGVGYYHAPFSRFYAFRYNAYDPITKMYYAGGRWATFPHESTINISSPTDDAAILAEATRTDVVRGGFGWSSGGYSTWG